MDILHRWIQDRLVELPPRKHVVMWEQSTIQLNTVTLQGKIRLVMYHQKPDTIICSNILTEHYGRVICARIHELLADDGILLIVSKNIHPGIMRFWLKPFAWRYITAFPTIGETYAIAGKGEKYYEQGKDVNGNRFLRRMRDVESDTTCGSVV